MFERIKNCLIEDIEFEIKDIEDKVKEYEIQLKDNNQKLNSIRTKSFIDKIFKTKKYKEQIKKKFILDEESFNINREILYENNRLKELFKKRDYINKIDDVSKLEFKNNDEMYNYCLDKQIEITNEESITYFEKQTSKNGELMFSLVKENINYIKKDKSNNVEIYKCFLAKKIYEFEECKNMVPIELKHEKEKQEIVVEFQKKLLDCLNNSSFDEKFNNYIFEWIRVNYDYFMDFKKLISLFNSDDYSWIDYCQEHNIKETIDLDKLYKLYQSDYGKELEEIYSDNKLLIGIHGTRYITEEIENNEIFKKGLKNSTQSGSINRLDRTVALNLPFLELLDYDGALYVPGANVPYNYIVTIPKEVLYFKGPIWGSNKEKSSENYLLPEYIYMEFLIEQTMKN